jgi:hypothetical protein
MASTQKMARQFRLTPSTNARYDLKSGAMEGVTANPGAAPDGRGWNLPGNKLGFSFGFAHWRPRAIVIRGGCEKRELGGFLDELSARQRRKVSKPRILQAIGRGGNYGRQEVQAFRNLIFAPSRDVTYQRFGPIFSKFSSFCRRTWYCTGRIQINAFAETHFSYSEMAADFVSGRRIACLLYLSPKSQKQMTLMGGDRAVAPQR